MDKEHKERWSTGGKERLKLREDVLVREGGKSHENIMKLM